MKKIWYQSLTRTDRWQGYNVELRKMLDAAKQADTEIEIHCIEKRGGIGDQFHYLESIEAQEVLENVQRAEGEGFDAFVIGNIGDPGLREARELATIPVLGLCETSTHLASMMGRNFALVTGNEKHATRIVDNVRRYGLGMNIHSVRSMSVERLVDLEDGFGNVEAREALVSEFLRAGEQAADEGAEVVIPSIGVLMVLLASQGINALRNSTVPVLNGSLALIKIAEAVIDIRHAMGGLWTSRRALYAQPPADQIDELRSAYGQVFNSVKFRRPA
ncbi:aspartate/glutamate racemase family protein [Candidimonas nitroreducens]|uniref:Hydantoin racemase n=1 Tax=Candidimonas nitroreducens TaxID=683354 RepID=A0A225M9H6_9BURK|nr:aspartate/glutamate racemase family protein [Candidimonas nitroreducens]OWT57382.1 hypothetical protein CEY11_15770 [Candidimonas nitroreducens]